MGKSQDKTAILQTIQSAAAAYENLVGQTFLYIFENQHIEVIYRRKDFMHLTGIDTFMSAEQFFRNIRKGIVKSNQIYFSQRHPYDLCKKKVQYLQCLPMLTNSDMIILEDIVTGTFTYKFGITDFSFTICLSKDTDKNGVPKSNYYIARSLRAGDELGKAQNAYEINCIFSKRNDEKKYGCKLYDDGKIRLNELPECITSLLDNSLFLS